MGGFAKKAGKHNREPSEEKIVLDVLRATHGRVKIRWQRESLERDKAFETVAACAARRIHTRHTSCCYTQRCIVGEEGC